MSETVFERAYRRVREKMSIVIKVAEADKIQCPVCGYYCLGKGGIGCIDKPSLQSVKQDEE